MKRVLLLFVTLWVALAGTLLSAQDLDKHTWNLPNYDDKWLHYGFFLGMNLQNYRLKLSDQFEANDTLASIHGQTTPGISLGFIVNMRINDQLDLRTTPTVSLYQKTVTYRFNESTGQAALKQNFEGTFIELPLMIKYKSMRRENHRMYMVFGGYFATEVSSRKKDKTDRDLRTEPMDFGIEYGIGSDHYFEFFKFAPELRFSLGLSNLLTPDDNFFAGNLERISTYKATLYLNFE